MTESVAVVELAVAVLVALELEMRGTVAVAEHLVFDILMLFRNLRAWVFLKKNMSHLNYL